jgi:hypothetical protein
VPSGIQGVMAKTARRDLEDIQSSSTSSVEGYISDVDEKQYYVKVMFSVGKATYVTEWLPLSEEPGAIAASYGDPDSLKGRRCKITFPFGGTVNSGSVSFVSEPVTRSEVKELTTLEKTAFKFIPPGRGI